MSVPKQERAHRTGVTEDKRPTVGEGLNRPCKDVETVLDEHLIRVFRRGLGRPVQRRRRYEELRDVVGEVSC